MHRDAPTKLVVLDRDGTLCQGRVDFIKSPEEWQPLPGALQAVAQLQHAGWRVVLATNQPGLGRGLFDMAALNAMHLKLNALLQPLGGRIDAVFFCPHSADEGCDCRKPAPGLLQLIAERYHLEPSQVPMVGDSASDVQAAHAAGMRAHLVRTGSSAQLSPEALASLLQAVPGTQVHTDLAAFAQALIHADRSQPARAPTPF